MFEDETKKDESSAKIWVGVAIASLLVIGGVYYYFSHLAASTPAAVSEQPAVAAGPVQTEPDAVKDLRIQRALMDKDQTGTMALWVVSIENKSEVFTYSDIQYETTYYASDDHVLLTNKGVIKTTITPGNATKEEIRDALYPTGTARFRFKITGATSSK